MDMTSFKQKSFQERLCFAWNGICHTWKSEKSFRFQSFAALGVCSLLLATKASAIWWAIMFVLMGAILASELINTALENSLDQLHPEVHPAIGVAKDCAAAAVLILSICSMGVLIAYALSFFYR
jgi:diacylglycerol kinase (ATP)